VVVGVHKPCISIGVYGCDGEQDINNLLVSKKVDLILNGHEHHYQRSKQIAFGAGCPGLVLNAYEPACVADADDSLAKGAGTVIATVGTGGIGLRDVSTSDAELGYFRTWSALNATPTHGFLDVRADADTLTARFLGTNGSYTDSFTISPGATPPPNTPPTARIAEPTCNGLACTFDGTGSSDAEGAVASYAWSFGDQTTGSGPTASRTFASAGTYSVTLTVTDSGGLTSSAVRQVTVAPNPAPSTLVSDSFTRTVVGGWGTADTGGAWSVTGSTSNVSVSGGVGSLVMRTAASGQVATLPSAPTTTNADVGVTLSLDKTGSAAVSYISVLGRRVVGAGDYLAKLRTSATSVGVSLERVSAAGAGAIIAPGTTIPYTAGTPLRVRLQVTGTAPTQVRAKVWRLGNPEPVTWTVATTDATSGLQAAGGVGLQTYLSSSATAAPVTLSVDDLIVTAAQP
jgi:PKD repeat protein